MTDEQGELKDTINFYVGSSILDIQKRDLASAILKDYVKRDRIRLDEVQIATILIDMAFKKSSTEFVLPDADEFAHTIATSPDVIVKGDPDVKV